MIFLEAIFRDCRFCNPLHQLALGTTLYHDVASSHADIRLTNLNWSVTKTNNNCQQIGLHETKNDKQNFVVFICECIVKNLLIGFCNISNFEFSVNV